WSEIKGERQCNADRKLISVYRLVNSIPELVVTLPTELASFRIIDGQQFLVSNGNDRLLRFRDIASPQTSELVVQTPGRFVDFTVRQ
ncbi:MAG: hypothetical protein MUD03_01275, partial [Pirellula sp.]|nr:hypothetical protein [Pirellula sp.]